MALALRAAQARSKSAILPICRTQPFIFPREFECHKLWPNKKGPKKAPFYLAERVRFELTWGVGPHHISSVRRYDRFGTSPKLYFYRGFPGKTKPDFKLLTHYPKKAGPRIYSVLLTMDAGTRF